MKRLIVNADDFGQSAGVNDGIVQAHEHGVVTSASLMVRWPYASAAAEYGRVASSLSVGLHIDLGEWVYRDGAWGVLYQRVPLDDPDAMRAEILDQLATFERLMRTTPTHLDSHQHVHGRALIKDIVGELGHRLGVPVRHDTQRINGEQLKHLGEFYGQGPKGRQLPECITPEHLIALFAKLPDGITELSCHPGLRSDAHGMYIAERAVEVQVLCDPRIRRAIAAERIDLISFHDLTRAGAGAAVC